MINTLCIIEIGEASWCVWWSLATFVAFCILHINEFLFEMFVSVQSSLLFFFCFVLNL